MRYCVLATVVYLYMEKVIQKCIIRTCINFYCYAEALGKCDEQCKGCKEEINGQQL